MLTIHSFADGVGEITHVLKDCGRLTATSLANAKKVFRQYLGTERTMQLLIEDTIALIERDCATIAKSEADATRNAESTDFDFGLATQGQRSAAQTRELQVQGLARAANRRLQSWGINDPSEADVDRAIAAVLNVSVVNREGENGITVDNSNPQVAASLRERTDGTIWELTDMADPRQQAAVGEEMAANAVASNFEGLRNLGYTATRSAAPPSTNFSGPTGGAPPVATPGTTAEPSTLPAASIQAIAQAAYAAGVAAASSNFAKRGRR